MRKLLPVGVIVAGIAVTGWLFATFHTTAEHAGAKPSPVSTAPSSSPSPTPTPSASISPALWGYHQHGVGPALLQTNFPVAVKTVTVRWTCVGGTKRTEIRSAAGGLFVGTLGCAKGVIYSSYAQRNARRDPRTIAVKVDPGVQWAIEVWAGRYTPAMPGMAA